MRLNDFLDQHGISMTSFAETLGTTAATVSRIADGTVVPRRDLMRRIHQETQGEVTPNDLTGLYCVRPCMGQKLTCANEDS